MAACKLPTRQLGKGGPQVSALGYGAMGLSSESNSCVVWFMFLILG